MLKLSGVLKAIAFVFTDTDGSVHNLEIREFTVADVNQLVKLQEPLIGNTEMPVIEQSNLIVSSRIICAVKDELGVPYWNSIDDLAKYPNELISSLYEKVNELNPMDFGEESLDEKKSES